MDNAHTVAKTLRALREKHKWTQMDLADRLGVVRATVASWETGRRIPEPDMLASIARLFEVSVDTLLGVQRQNAPVREDEEFFYFLRGQRLTEEDKQAVRDLLEARRLRREREERDKGQP